LKKVGDRGFVPKDRQ